jgi:hypothetical protein
MGASHASKGGRRWRYYVSRAALSGRQHEAGSIVRSPAAEIENRVADAVGAHLVVHPCGEVPQSATVQVDPPPTQLTN